MKTALRHTLSFLLAGFFLVSFTGFRLIVHHCMGCEINEVVFSAELTDCCRTVQETPSCCQEHATAEGETPACDLQLTEECCNIQAVYLMGDFELISERTTVKIDIPVVVAWQATSDIISGPTPETRVYTAGASEDPPPRLTGRDFVLYAHQLKIS